MSLEEGERQFRITEACQETHVSNRRTTDGSSKNENLQQSLSGTLPKWPFIFSSTVSQLLSPYTGYMATEQKKNCKNGPESLDRGRAATPPKSRVGGRQDPAWPGVSVVWDCPGILLIPDALPNLSQRLKCGQLLPGHHPNPGLCFWSPFSNFCLISAFR